jgi:hypothetical protein
VKIADDYAIRFAEWILDTVFKKYSNGWEKLLIQVKYALELLEIFKRKRTMIDKITFCTVIENLRQQMYPDRRTEKLYKRCLAGLADIL